MNIPMRRIDKRGKPISLAISERDGRRLADRARREVGASTPERLEKSGLPFNAADGKSPQRIAMAPLDRLAGKMVRGISVISKRQFDAGDRLREDLYTAGMVPSSCFAMELRSDASMPGPAWTKSDRAAAALGRSVEASLAIGKPLMKIIQAVLWPEDGITSMSHMGMKLFARSDRASAEAAMVEALRLALTTLADHYKLGENDCDSD